MANLSMSERIVRYIQKHPGCVSSDIARELKVLQKDVTARLSNIKKTRPVKYAEISFDTDCYPYKYYYGNGRPKIERQNEFGQRI